MINIQIDVASLLESVTLSDDQVRDLMDSTIRDITLSFSREWERAANDNLKSSRAEYIANLVVVDEGFAKGAVVLNGWLPNAVESGLDAFDMKQGFLDGPNAKESKDGGKYNTIPFKHGTPGSLPENFSGGIMPKEVHKVIKKERVSSVTGKSRQLTLGDLPEPFKAKKVKQLTGGRTYEHKNAIYEGLRKSVDKAGNVGYESFRRVSDKSDPNSWEHPGIEAKGIADIALREFDINNALSIAFNNWWNQNM